MGGGSGGGGGVTGVGRGSVLQMSFLYHGSVQPQSKYGWRVRVSSNHKNLYPPYTLYMDGGWLPPTIHPA